jgi:hypothetical protein
VTHTGEGVMCKSAIIVEVVKLGGIETARGMLAMVRDELHPNEVMYIEGVIANAERGNK